MNLIRIQNTLALFKVKFKPRYANINIKKIVQILFVLLKQKKATLT